MTSNLGHGSWSTNSVTVQGEGIFSRSLCGVILEKVVKVKVLVAQLCPTLRDPRAVARQAPQSMEFSRQEYWSGLPLLSPEDRPNPGIEPGCPALQIDSLPPEPPGKPSFSRVPVCYDLRELSHKSGQSLLSVRAFSPFSFTNSFSFSTGPQSLSSPQTSPAASGREKSSLLRFIPSAGSLFTHVAPSLTPLLGQRCPPLPLPPCSFLISSLWHLTQHLALSRPFTDVWSPTFCSSGASLGP